MPRCPQKVLPTVGGDHTHNDYIELTTGKVVAKMLATENSVYVWQAIRPLSICMCVAGYTTPLNLYVCGGLYDPSQSVCVWRAIRPLSICMCLAGYTTPLNLYVCGRLYDPSQSVCVWQAIRPLSICMCVAGYTTPLNLYVCGGLYDPSQSVCVWRAIRPLSICMCVAGYTTPLNPTRLNNLNLNNNTTQLVFRLLKRVGQKLEQSLIRSAGDDADKTRCTRGGFSFFIVKITYTLTYT